MDFAGIFMGGGKIGSLEKRMQFILLKGQLSSFLERLQQRLANIGFVPGDQTGHFVQGGVISGQGQRELTSFTHAKTRKLLTVAVSAHSSQEISVELTARYLECIVGDTGEAAYRDALLNYASGTTETMAVVPNKSFMAFSCFVGGAFAWPALIYLKSIQYEPLFLLFLIFVISEILVGITAISSIKQKPGELTGITFAIMGMISSALALIFAAWLSFDSLMSQIIQ